MIDGPQHNSSRHSVIDSDSDSDNDLKPPSTRFRALKTSSKTSSLRSGTSSIKKKQVNHIAIDLRDPCASIVTPTNMVDHDILQAAINALVQQP